MRLEIGIFPLVHLSLGVGALHSHLRAESPPETLGLSWPQMQGSLKWPRDCPQGSSAFRVGTWSFKHVCQGAHSGPSFSQ